MQGNVWVKASNKFLDVIAILWILQYVFFIWYLFFPPIVLSFYISPLHLFLSLQQIAVKRFTQGMRSSRWTIRQWWVSLSHSIHLAHLYFYFIIHPPIHPSVFHLCMQVSLCIQQRLPPSSVIVDRIMGLKWVPFEFKGFNVSLLKHQEV